MKPCFDVTAALHEQPIALWLGYRAQDLVLCSACKTDGRRWIVAQWEVENGIHKQHTICSVSIRPQKVIRMALNKLLPLFGSGNKDASDVKIVEYVISNTEEFWNKVNELQLHKVIVRSRLSDEVQKKIINAAQ